MPEKYIIVLLCFDKDLYICASLNLLIEKTMKKIILLFLVVCNCLICSSAEISKEVLTANTWKVVYPDFHGNKIHIIKVYKDNTLEIRVTYVTLNETVSALFKYYLTDKKTSEFDIDKVGGADTGCYLVFANTKDLEAKEKFFVCWENISTDKNIIEFRDEVGQKWILEKQ